MKKLIGRILENNTKKVLLLLYLFLTFSTNSCINSLDSGSSDTDDPFGTQQIVLNILTSSIFGNGCSFVDIEALFNPALTPNGAIIRVELNSPDLPSILEGCITSLSSPVVIDGEALINYLTSTIVGLGISTVNLAVTSTLPNGDSQTNFVTIPVARVNIVDVIGPTSITTNPVPGLPPVFATIQVLTLGIPPGTFVDFELTDPSLGFLSGATPVLGTVFDGIAVVQYTATDGVGGTQTIIITLILPDPSTKDPACDPVPIQFRTIEAFITFEQIVAPPEPTPTPTPPVTPTIDVTAFNEVISPGGTTIITATTNTGANTDVCCDIPIQSDPLSTLDSMVPDCGVTDINGDFFSVLTGGNVVTLQTIRARCCIDSNTMTSSCDPEEPQDSVFVDIDPAGVPPPITLAANPSIIPPGGQSIITASTNPAIPAGDFICFEIVVDSSPSSTLIGGPCVGASSLGQSVIGLQGGNVTTQQSVAVRGCIDQDTSGGCDGTEPSNFVTVTITPPSPAIPIIISSADLNPMAGTSTGINAFTNQPIGTDVCVQFIMNSSPASNLDPGDQALATCGVTDVDGNVLGLFALDVDAGAGGDQITIIGCIDNMPNNSMCDVGEQFSNILTFNVPM